MWSKRSFFLGIALPWILGGIIGFADDQYYELVDYDEEYKEDAGAGTTTTTRKAVAAAAFASLIISKMTSAKR